MTESEFEKRERNKRNKLKQATVDDVRIKITKLEATLPDAEIGIIPLAHGLFAIVDKELFTELDRSIWHLAIQPEHTGSFLVSWTYQNTAKPCCRTSDG